MGAFIMEREELVAWMEKEFHCVPSYPWIKYPDYAVFRHPPGEQRRKNDKWFALLMKISEERIGKSDSIDVCLDVINVKCNPELVYYYVQQPGIYPGYHMNKRHWITLDIGVVEVDTIQELIHDSFQLTMA